jgi:hypothetical protein
MRHEDVPRGATIEGLPETFDGRVGHRSCPPNLSSSFVSWLVKPNVDSLVNSSSCIGSSVITIRTFPSDG